MESQQKEGLKMPQTQRKAKVFVSGCYDLLHSGHVEFFRQAAQYGDLYVGIGSDKTIEGTSTIRQSTQNRNGCSW